MPKFQFFLGGTCKIGHLSREACSQLMFDIRATLGTWCRKPLDGVTFNVECIHPYSQEGCQGLFIANTYKQHQKPHKLTRY